MSDAAALAAFRTAEADVDPFNGLIGAERYFNAACDAGEVAPLTLDAIDLAAAPEDTAARIAAVRDRLHRLGYPMREVAKEKRSQWDPDVASALARFQREASLSPADGELTVKTWDALQELFNFETPLRVAAWFSPEGEACPPLLRALRLRLSVLGFGEPPTAEAQRPEDRVLELFRSTAVSLGVAFPTEARVTAEFAAAIFAHDALGNALAESGEKLAGLRGRERERAEHLLVCFAKIELWLHGYDVAPDGSSVLVEHQVRGKGAVPRSDRANKTADQFNRFFAELAPDEVRPQRAAMPAAIPERVPEMLARMRELRATQALPKETASAEIVGLLEAELEKSPGLWSQLREAGAQLVGILFDGVRRVFAWIGRLLKRVWSAVTAAAVNLWRAVHHFMGGAAFYFRKAVRALSEGVEFLVSPGFPSEPCGHACYSRRVDFDGALLIDDGCEEPVVTRFSRTLVRKSQALAIACRIIRLVCTAVRMALLGPAAGLGGFVPMMLGLASVFSQVRQLGRMLDALPDAC